MNACFEGSGKTRTSVQMANSSACMAPWSKVWCLWLFSVMSAPFVGLVGCTSIVQRLGAGANTGAAHA